MISENINLLGVLDSKRFPGISFGLGTRLLDQFGAKGTVERIHNKSEEALSSVRGISGAKANTLIVGDMKSPGLLDLALYLDEVKLDKPYARKFYAVWGTKAMEVIKSNPYVLLVIMDWKEVDPLGLKLGNEFHPCRVIAAIEWCMYREYEEHKHTCTDHNTLEKKVCKLLSCDETTFRRGLRLAVQSKAVVVHRGVLQIPAAHWYEDHIETFLKDNDRTHLSDADINKWLKDSIHNKVNERQRKAVINALRHRISAYCGRGGRGKTFTLTAIADGAKSLLGKKRVILTAVAAKAVNRMREETGFPAQDCRTIAGLLYTEKVDNLHDAMVIIDEASMLSLVDAFRVIKKLPNDTHIVMLGDQNQIPSIQAGRLFYDIIKSGIVPSIELTESHRHDKKTDDQLMQVLSGEFPILDEYHPNVGTGLYRCLVKATEDDIDPIHVAEDEAVKLYKDFLKRGETAQIISPLRDQKYSGSSDRINRKAHGNRIKQGFCEGTPVVWTRNTTVEDGTTLANGSIGIVSEVFGRGNEYWLSVAFEHEGSVLLKWHEVDEYLDYAYCLSVHRAQGSEWDNVIIVLPNSEKMIDRNMVYTSLSRCKKRSIAVYHNHSFIRTKVSDPPAHERRRSVFLQGG